MAVRVVRVQAEAGEPPRPAEDARAQREDPRGEFTLTQAEAALTSGAADMVALGRPLFAHPDWPYIVRSGVAYPWLAFDRKYVIQPPLDFGHAYPMGLVDPEWPQP